MGLVLVTPAASEPLGLVETKKFLRVEQDLDDDLVSMLITDAREDAEHHTERQLVTATWRLTLDSFPSGDGGAVLPRPPLQSVTGITYVDVDGTTQTLSIDLYSVDTESEPGWVVPAFDVSWPDTRMQTNAVSITYTAGYGGAEDVPRE